MNIIVIGAGISGLAAAYELNQHGYHPVVLEKDATYGGLCSNFEIDGFRFDRFAHFSFAKDERVNDIFTKGAPEVFRHTPQAYNLYHGTWIKHPAQNNLYPLPAQEKEKIIADFKNRKNPETTQIRNYEDWLRVQFGDYFAEHFPMAYTRKYWMTDASGLETEWVGQRVYQPSVDEVIYGAEHAETPVTYYAKEMRYPKKGGFKSYLSAMPEGLDIRYNEGVSKIDAKSRKVTTTTGKVYDYDVLISSTPLPEVIKMLDDVPDAVREAASRLRCTHGYQVSVGFRGDAIPPYLWWYIYDEDILPSRIYSPSMKSPDNVPEGCSSLQMEIYCDKDKYTEAQLIEMSVGRLVEQGIIKEDNIMMIDVRYEPYANVIFDHNIYESRKMVRDYLSSIGIHTIGRFGEWDYLWTDQSLLSGLNIVYSL